MQTHDILLFYGARQVGKTTLMKILEKDYIKQQSYFFDLENPDYLQLLNQNPNIFVEYLISYHGRDKQTPIVVFIDEVQYLNNPTNFLKYIYDNYPSIKLIVSWSSTLEIRGKLHDSLVWRLIKFDVLPLSFEEFLVFKGKENLSALIWKPVTLDIINQELQFFFSEYVQYGGYPKIVLAHTQEIKKAYLQQIYNTYIEKDIKDIGNIRELHKFNMLLQVLANQSGSLINISELSNTIGVTAITVNEWILLLENTFVIKTIRPFSTNLRGELTKMPKIFFVDNGVRNYINNSYILSWESFENSFFNSVNNAYKAEKIGFYRTQDKKEIDFVLDGIPYELKLYYNGKNLTALNYFNEKYHTQGNVVTLKKTMHKKYNVWYPWEI